MEECPKDFNIDGILCIKPQPYGVGLGYAWQFGDSLDDIKQFERCEAANPSVGCEKFGLLVYPKCMNGFKKAADAIAFLCAAFCPDEYEDLGVSCKKPCATAKVLLSEIDERLE